VDTKSCLRPVIDSGNILDYRFAWRWLLPLQGCESYRLYGFNKEEKRFWNKVLKSNCVVTGQVIADILMLNSDCSENKERPTDNDFDDSNMVCVIGSRSSVKRWRAVLSQKFPQIREYGLLPTSNPRIVVPLSNTRYAEIALSLHRPGRLIARWGIGAARLLARWGITFPLKRRVLLIGVRKQLSIPIGVIQANELEILPEQDLDYALYLGVSGENRKTVVLPIFSAKPEVILKVGESQGARQSLLNEVAVLQGLYDSSIASNVPRLIKIKDTKSALTLFQEYRARQQVAERLSEAAIIDFLGQLSTIERKLCTLDSVLENITSPEPIESNKNIVSDVVRAIWSRLSAQADKGINVWQHRSHGDFAPWNISWTDKGLFVYDWEESRDQDLAFSDAFYFVVGKAVHIGRQPNPARTLRATLKFAQRVVVATGFNNVDLNTYFALWALRRIDLAPIYVEMLRMHLANWE